jgi:hypothetical protein
MDLKVLMEPQVALELPVQQVVKAYKAMLEQPALLV